MTKLTILVLFIAVTMVAAGARYIAIPIDGIDVIEVNPILSSVTRYPRHTEAHFAPDVQGETESQVPRIERSQIMDYVDFGAQTGANGAYSWYADYPAQQ